MFAGTCKLRHKTPYKEAIFMFNFAYRLRIVPFIILLFFISACGSESDPYFVTDVRLSATETTFAAGETQLIEGVAIYSNGDELSASSGNSIWSSDAESIATVDASGLVTGVSPGTTQINARYLGGSDTDEPVTGSISITISPALLVEIEIYTEVRNVPLGVNVQYTAIGIYGDGNRSVLESNSDMVWESDNTEVATIDSLTGFTETLMQGTSTIRINDFQGISSSSELTVNAESLVGLSIAPMETGETSVPVGYTLSFTAEATYTDDSTKDVTQTVDWDSSENLRLNPTATKGTFEGIVQGDSVISATLMSEASNAITATVTPEVLVRVDIESDKNSYPIGIITQLTARAYFSDNSDKNITDEKNVTWENDDSGFATVDATGLLTANDVGDVTITFSTRNADDVVFEDMQVFTITDAELVSGSVTVIPNDVYLVPGQSQQYIAMGQYTDGTEHILNNQPDIVWSLSELSDAEDIVSINPKSGRLRNYIDNGLATTEQVFVDVSVQGNTNMGGAYANLGAVKVLSTNDELRFSGPLLTIDKVQLDMTFASDVEHIEDGLSGPENTGFMMVTQAEAETECNNLVYNKRNDYRLPSAAELASLWNKYDGEVEVPYKLYTEQNWSVGQYFWTSTAGAADGTFEIADLREGSTPPESMDTEYHYFSCVRSTVIP